MVLARRWLEAATRALAVWTRDDEAATHLSMAGHGRDLAVIDCDDGVDVVLDVMIPVLVLCLMFGMGATVTFSDLKTAAMRRPKALFTGASSVTLLSTPGAPISPPPALPHAPRPRADARACLVA